MLGKLIKHEFKNTSKVMLSIYGLVIGVTLLGTIIFAFMNPEVSTSFTDFATRAMLLLYGLSIFALFVVTYVYVCVHFYKTMYSDQGYQTHTLPVSSVTTFHVKLLVSFCWMMGAMLLLLLSVFMLLIGASHGEILQMFSAEFRTEFVTELSSLGLAWGEFVFFAIFSLIISCVSYLLLVYASMSIGQLFNQNKIGFSIIAGIVIYFVEQIVSTILTVSLGLSSSEVLFDEASTTSDAAIMTFWSDMMCSSFLLSVLFVLALYLICVVIVRKHINLD